MLRGGCWRLVRRVWLRWSCSGPTAGPGLPSRAAPSRPNPPSRAALGNWAAPGSWSAPGRSDPAATCSMGLPSRAALGSCRAAPRTSAARRIPANKVSAPTSRLPTPDGAHQFWGVGSKAHPIHMVFLRCHEGKQTTAHTVRCSVVEKQQGGLEKMRWLWLWMLRRP